MTTTERNCTGDLAHLDLDVLAWQAGTPLVHAPLDQAHRAILDFMEANDQWVIEGCYGDLVALVADRANEMIWMNLPVAACAENARRRPWEPHKYPSKAAQDANLEMLIDWIADYSRRDDACSEAMHRRIYEDYRGRKFILTENSDTIRAAP